MTINVADAEGPVDTEVTGEIISPFFAVTPVTCGAFGDGEGLRFRGDWLVTHIPSGHSVPRSERQSIEAAAEIARGLTALDDDWSSSDPNAFAKNPGLGKRVLEVLEQHPDDDDAVWDGL